MPKPGHVVFLATDFRPMVGGIAESIHGLAEHLAHQLPVSVMTSVPQNGASGDDAAYELVRLPRLPQRRLGDRIGDGFGPTRKLQTGAYFLALRQYAARTIDEMRRRTDGDLAAVIGSWETASHFWCEACRRAAVPYYLLAHGSEMLVPLYGDLPAWRRQDFADATGVLANSRATADLAVKLLGIRSRPFVLNLPVGPRPSSPALTARVAELRKDLGVRDGLVVLSVGRLVARKGVDLVLRSVATLRAEYPGLTYIVAGDGPERASLDALVTSLGIGDCVRRLGQVDEVTKWALYEVCDLFVMPNRLMGGRDWEGFGLVFVEAALCERPAIGGCSGGVPDAIEQEVTGLLVDPEEAGALTAGMRRLLADPALRRRMGRRAEARARTEFSGDAIATRLRAALGWN